MFRDADGSLLSIKLNRTCQFNFNVSEGFSGIRLMMMMGLKQIA